MTDQEAFNPYGDDLYERGAEGFLRLLQELAPHLEESLTVHVVAYLGRRFPLAACEWHVELGGTAIEVNEFRHGADDLTVQVIRPEQPLLCPDSEPYTVAGRPCHHPPGNLVLP